MYTVRSYKDEGFKNLEKGLNQRRVIKGFGPDFDKLQIEFDEAIRQRDKVIKENTELKTYFDSLISKLELNKKEIGKLEEENKKLQIQLGQKQNQFDELTRKAKIWKERNDLYIELKKDEVLNIIPLTEEAKERIKKEKSLNEINEYAKQFDLEKITPQKLQIKNNEEGKSAKEMIIKLLKEGGLEEKNIIESLQSQGIPEGTIRQALRREEGKIFERNQEGNWELRL